jgi:hypothetical protein
MQIVSLNYIDFLLLSKQYKEAAEWCGKTALTSKDWEEKILIFAKEGKLEVKQKLLYHFEQNQFEFKLGSLRTFLRKFLRLIQL